MRRKGDPIEPIYRELRITTALLTALCEVKGVPLPSGVEPTSIDPWRRLVPYAKAITALTTVVRDRLAAGSPTPTGGPIVCKGFTPSDYIAWACGNCGRDAEAHRPTPTTDAPAQQEET